MSTKTQKIVAAITATALAASVVLGGTLAWQSINQEATNIVSGTINPGGRLHDDFDGNNRNKDIYVENFADQEIYARIQLREYLEIGTTEPGTTTDSLVIPAAANGKSDAATAGNVDSWAIHYFDETKNETDKYVDFTWGGMTTYLPTFNMNKDSLLADINGTYEGLYQDGSEPTGTSIEDDRYSDYVDYATVTGGVTGYEVWDADLDNDDEVGEDVDTLITLTDSAGTSYTTFQDAAESFLVGGGTDYTTSFTEVIKDQPTAATHIPTTTLDATVISMADWKAMDPADQAVFYGWVYDTDGWAYWSQPIEPKTVDPLTNEVTSDNTTGLLLDAINPRIDDNYYYQIHVIAQFITANDLGQTDGTGFFAGDKGSNPSADALALLNTIGVNIAGGSTLSVTSSAASVAPGGNVTLTATNPTTNTAVTGATWIINGSNVASTFSTTPATATAIDPTTGILTVAATEQASKLTVIAIFEDETTDSSTGVKTKNTLIGSYDITVSTTASTPEYTVTVTAAGNATIVDAGKTLQFNAAVTKNGETHTPSSITWSVDPGTTGSTIDAGTGLLTAGDTAGEVTVTATAEGATGTCTVTVAVPLTETQQNIVSASVGDTVSINGTNYYVVVKDTSNSQNRALLWATAPVAIDGGTTAATVAYSASDNVWSTSSLRTTLNDTTFMNSLGEIKDDIMATQITTAAEHDRTGGTDGYETTTDSVFLLSQADVFGQAWNGSTDADTSDAREYTYGTSQIVTDSMRGWTVSSGTQYAWVRSPRNGPNTMAAIGSDGTVGNYFYYGSTYVRPAFWVNLGAYKVTVTAAGDATSVAKGETLQFSAAVTQNGKICTPSSIVWSVDAGTTGATIDPDTGLLTAGTTIGEVIVKATAAGVTGVYKVKVTTAAADFADEVAAITAGSTSTVTIDGLEWYVLAKDEVNNKALLFAKSVLKDTSVFDDNSVIWEGSTLQTYLNDTWLPTMTTLNKYAAETTFQTANTYTRDASTTFTTSTDKVFVLSEADVYGTANNSSTTDVREYTLGTAGSIVPSDLRAPNSTGSWLRSPYGGSTNVACIYGSGGGSLSYHGGSNTGYVRPALWVNLADVYTVTVTAANDATTVTGGKTLQFSAAVTKNGETYTPDSIVWTVDAGTTGSTIDASTGLLTAGSTSGEVTVKATAEGITGVYKVNVTTVAADFADEVAAITAGSTDTVTIDGLEWYVLAKDEVNNKALLFVKNVLKKSDGTDFTSVFDDNGSVIWEGSTLQTYLNDTWLPTMTTLNKYAAETTFQTANTYTRNESTTFTTSTDKVFVLSEADVYGSANNSSTTDVREYTLGTAASIVPSDMRAPEGLGSRLRSPGDNSTCLAGISYAGTLNFTDDSIAACVRPALWVNLAS